MAITVRFAWALAFILVGVTSPGTTAGVVIGLTVVAAASLHDARNQTLRHWSLSSLSWRRFSLLDRQTLSPDKRLRRDFFIGLGSTDRASQIRFDCRLRFFFCLSVFRGSWQLKNRGLLSFF